MSNVLLGTAVADALGVPFEKKLVNYPELVAKLREHNVPASHASGFPADQKNGINLGNTPRVGSCGGRVFPREATLIQSYLRV